MTNQGLWVLLLTLFHPGTLYVGVVFFEVQLGLVALIIALFIAFTCCFASGFAKPHNIFATLAVMFATLAVMFAVSGTGLAVMFAVSGTELVIVSTVSVTLCVALSVMFATQSAKFARDMYGVPLWRGMLLYLFVPTNMVGMAALLSFGTQLAQLAATLVWLAAVFIAIAVTEIQSKYNIFGDDTASTACANGT